MTNPPNEHAEQVAVIEWALTRLGAIPALELLHAIPNGGHRHKAVAARLKAEGVKRGVPDLCLPVACQSYHGLYVEMKQANGRPSKEQLWWRARLIANGYRVAICYGAAEAIETIEEYLCIPAGERTELFK